MGQIITDSIVRIFICTIYIAMAKILIVAATVAAIVAATSMHHLNPTQARNQPQFFGKGNRIFFEGGGTHAQILGVGTGGSWLRYYA